MAKRSLDRIAEMKRTLPYGFWTCKDGRKVLFNRGYRPLLQRIGNAVTPADPEERVDFEKQEWFYTDANPPWHSKPTFKKCMEILDAWA